MWHAGTCGRPIPSHERRVVGVAGGALVGDEVEGCGAVCAAVVAVDGLRLGPEGVGHGQALLQGGVEEQGRSCSYFCLQSCRENAP